MHELSIRLADFDILVRARHTYVVNQCKDYLCPAPLTEETADLIVEASEEELAEEKKKNPPHMQEGYMESICVYRAICRKLPLKGAMLLHGAVISDGTYGYAFTANSGVGKTTHIKLWQKAFGKEISIVNGDKPIIRKKDGRWYAYGTPWCGKHGINRNASAPIKGVAFLHRGKENSIKIKNRSDVLIPLLNQAYRPKEDLDYSNKFFDEIERFINSINFYDLYCNISTEAVEVAYNGMK